jgi:hypothetical protein
MGKRYAAPIKGAHHLGDWLKVLKLKQADLARLLETSGTNVHRWFDPEESSRVDIDILASIANALRTKEPRLEAGDLLKHPDKVKAIWKMEEAVSVLSDQKEPRTKQ